jgi:hypothetical protein
MILDFYPERAVGDSRRCVSKRVRGRYRMLGTIIGDAVLHIRLSRIAADPPALNDCVAYIESEVRQAVEFRPGSLGISVLADRAEGAALFGSLRRR